MKGRLLDLTLAAAISTLALAYYFGHDFVTRLLIIGPAEIMRLAGR